MYNKLRRNYFKRRKFIEKILRLNKRKQRIFFWKSKKKLFLTSNWRPMRLLIRKKRLKLSKSELWRSFVFGWWLFLKKFNNILAIKKRPRKLKLKFFKKKTSLWRKRLAKFKRKQKWRMLRFAKYRPNALYPLTHLRRNNHYFCSKNLTRTGWIQRSIWTKRINKAFNLKIFLRTNTAFLWSTDFGTQFFGFLPDQIVRALIFNKRFKNYNKYIIAESNSFWPPIFQKFNLKSYIGTFIKKKTMVDRFNKVPSNFRRITNSYNFFLGLQLLYLRKYLQKLRKKLYLWRRTGRKKDIFFSSWRYLNSTLIYRNRTKASYTLLNQLISSRREISAFLRTRKKRKKPHSTRKKFNFANMKRLKMRKFHPKILRIRDRKFVEHSWSVLYKNSISELTKVPIDINMKKLKKIAQSRVKNTHRKVRGGKPFLTRKFNKKIYIKNSRNG